MFISAMKDLCVQFFNRKSAKSAKYTRSQALDAATEGAVELDMHDNFAARVAHIVVEEGTKELLQTIYECAGSKASVDDKQERANELWEKIEGDFLISPLGTWNSSTERTKALQVSITLIYTTIVKIPNARSQKRI